MTTSQPKTMHILIAIPSEINSQKGNTITAKRYKHLLEPIGHSVEIINTYTNQEADLLIAIHAIKSAPSIIAWKKQSQKPLILMLGGTDIYRDSLKFPDTYNKSLNFADKVIVLEPEAYKKIPAEYQPKTHIIYQSANPQIKQQLNLNKPFQIGIIGHLRETKNPFFTIEQIHKTDLPVEIKHLGKALSPEMEVLARTWNAKDNRYNWKGELPQSESLQIVSECNILSHPSVIDSGASALVESIVIGTPVIASNIAGNKGLFGEDYQGYFDLNTPDQYLQILTRAIEDKEFYNTLKKQCAERAHLFTPEKEQAALKNLLEKLS